MLRLIMGQMMIRIMPRTMILSQMLIFLFMTHTLELCSLMLNFQLDLIQKNAYSLQISILKLLFSQLESNFLRIQLLIILIQLVNLFNTGTSVNIHVNLAVPNMRMMMKIFLCSLLKIWTF